MADSTPRVSICLPVWNGARELERLLPRLREQHVEGGLEIVAVAFGRKQPNWQQKLRTLAFETPTWAAQIRTWIRRPAARLGDIVRIVSHRAHSRRQLMRDD